MYFDRVPFPIALKSGQKESQNRPIIVTDFNLLITENVAELLAVIWREYEVIVTSNRHYGKSAMPDKNFRID